MLSKRKFLCIFLFLIIIINSFALYLCNFLTSSYQGGEIADTARLFSKNASAFFEDILQIEKGSDSLCKDIGRRCETKKNLSNYTVYLMLKGPSCGAFSAVGICFLALSITVLLPMRLRIKSYTYKKDGKKRFCNEQYINY